MYIQIGTSRNVKINISTTRCESSGHDTVISKYSVHVRRANSLVHKNTKIANSHKMKFNYACYFYGGVNPVPRNPTALITRQLGDTSRRT